MRRANQLWNSIMGYFLAYVLDLPSGPAGRCFSAVCGLLQHTAFILLRNRRGLLSLLPRCVLPFSPFRGPGEEPGFSGSCVRSIAGRYACPAQRQVFLLLSAGWSVVLAVFGNFPRFAPKRRLSLWVVSPVPYFHRKPAQKGSEAPSRSHLPAPLLWIAALRSKSPPLPG